MRRTWAGQRPTSERDESSAGSSRRGTVRLPMLSTRAVLALAVVLVLCLVTCSERGQAVRPERSHLLLKNNGHLDSVVFSPDGYRLAWSKWNRTVATLAWEAVDRLGITSDTPLDCGGIGTCLAFSADGSLLAVGLRDGRLMLWDTRSWSARSLKLAQGLLVQAAAFAPDGTVMAAGADSTVTLWDLPSGKQRSSLQGHRSRVGHLIFSADGRTLASSDADGLVILWEWPTGRRCATLNPESLIRRMGFPLAFSPDGKTLAFANQCSQITLWDVSAGKRIAAMGDSLRPIMAMAVSGDGKLLAAGGTDGLIECWDMDTYVRTAVLREHEGAVCALAFSRDGRQLMSSGIDGALRLWHQGQDFPCSDFSGPVAPCQLLRP